MGVLDGAIDLHLHAAPSVFPRQGDALELATTAREAGMRGILLKAHEGSTAEVAALADRATPGVEVVGGVVLNRTVGGINPVAVETCARLGGRCVWFPTIDSLAHCLAYGRTGGYREQPGGTARSEPVQVVDGADGELLPQAMEVIATARDHGMLVATGHLGWNEVQPLLRAAADLGHGRVLVQHPLFRVPGLDQAQVDEAIRLGAHVELTALSAAPGWRHTTVDECVRLLAGVPADTAVVSSDGGQSASPAPPYVLASFVEELAVAGVDEATLHRATHDTPARLLGMSTTVATGGAEIMHNAAGRDEL